VMTMAGTVTVETGMVVTLPGRVTVTAGSVVTPPGTVMNTGGPEEVAPEQPNASRARAMRQAVEAWMKGVPLKEFAEDHKELETALKFWGT